jgi:hypothetical protein
MTAATTRTLFTLIGHNVRVSVKVFGDLRGLPHQRAVAA